MKLITDIRLIMSTTGTDRELIIKAYLWSGSKIEHSLELAREDVAVMCALGPTKANDTIAAFKAINPWIDITMSVDEDAAQMIEDCSISDSLKRFEHMTA